MFFLPLLVVENEKKISPMELKDPCLYSTKTTFLFSFFQTLYQEINQGGRGSIELPVLATNNLPEAPPVSLPIKDISGFSDMRT